MPDGSRHGRRFLKSDKLQVIFRCAEVLILLVFGTYPIFIFFQLNLTAFLFQSLFDFIDIGRGVKPGTYKLVSSSLTVFLKLIPKNNFIFKGNSFIDG